MDQIKNGNLRIMGLLSHYLTNDPTFIRVEMMESVMECGVDSDTAFAMLMAAAMGIDVEFDAIDKVFYYDYFPHMIHCMRRDEYLTDPYYASIRFDPVTIGDCVLKYEKYQPYEAFVCDDILTMENGKRVPQIGYFDKEFLYPAVLEGGRLWMSITPNEINTMKLPIEKASGRVLTFGLGLGYYAYMTSRKPNVESVTVIEQNQDVIDLFKACILPQFDNKDKIDIIQGDAFEYALSEYPREKYDFIFTDIWHDVSDGMSMYMRMKRLEPLAPRAVHMYWIENTLKCYLQEA